MEKNWSKIRNTCRTRVLTSVINKKNLPNSKKAQVTIFIIIGIIIIALVLLFLVFRKEIIPDTGGKPEETPESFLDLCLKDKVYEAIDLIGEHGGYIDPDKSEVAYKTFTLTGEEPKDITYLCYTKNYYQGCVNQEPMLLNHLSGEIGNYIKDDVRECWDELGKGFEDQGYVVEAKYKGFDVILKEKEVVVEINGELTLTKTGETAVERGFKAIAPSKFYELAVLTQEIVSQETVYGGFSNLGYMILYPEKEGISRIVTGDGSEIYILESRETKERFIFAVRSWVLPPGFG